MMIDLHSIGRLADEDLLLRTRQLVQTGCALEAELLVLIGEIDQRKLYLEHAYSSMFTFCTGELGCSEDAAYNRITVARVARRYPAVLAELREGRVHLSGLRLLAPHLDEENHRALLEAARGKSKRTIEEQVARIAPKPDVPAMIRKLPDAPVPAQPSPSPSPPAVPAATAPLLGVAPAPAAPPPSRADVRPIVQPLSAESYKVQFTASRQLRDKLREAQDLLRHQVPGDDLAKVVERAIDLLIERVKKERFAAGRKPRKPREQPIEGAPRSPVSRHIPDAIKRAVYERDGGRCAFVDPEGRRCPETGRLEYDHLDGFARKGVHSVERIRLACSAHNAHAADRMYGRDFMRRARARRGAKEKAPAHGGTRPGAS